ncbi:hypothetical protein BDR07DRAFT_581076 [Suillus spraguei]|nr:hypothetical protein BDR07DRAFT_581076 [Suillus spraguei]
MIQICHDNEQLYTSKIPRAHRTNMQRAYLGPAFRRAAGAVGGMRGGRGFEIDFLASWRAASLSGMTVGRGGDSRGVIALRIKLTKWIWLWEPTAGDSTSRVSVPFCCLLGGTTTSSSSFRFVPEVLCT